MRQEIKNWWEQAEADLKAAESNFNQSIFYVASFLSQQAVEKALKALVLKEHLNFPKVHDLIFLARKVNAPEEIIEKCDELTWVYTETRYPDLSGENPYRKFTKNIAKKHLFIGKEILQWIEKKIFVN